MKALRNHQDGLKIDDIPMPSPRAGEVLIKVDSAAITAYELNWSETTDRKSPPIPAHDVAGTIAKVGEGVSGFKEGDEIFALVSFSRDGAAAEYAIASAGELAIKPRNLTFEEAAAIPLSALTAWQAIHQQIDTEPDQKVLITGAGGGTGIMIVQIAAAARLLVSATCSAEKHDLVKSMGASEVFDYHKTSMEDLSHEYDFVIDCVGGKTLRQCFDLVKPGGRLVTLPAELTAEENALRPDTHANFFIVEPDGEQLAQIAQLCESDAVKPVLRAVLPLDEGAKAFEMLAEGHSAGKIVLKVDQKE